LLSGLGEMTPERRDTTLNALALSSFAADGFGGLAWRCPVWLSAALLVGLGEELQGPPPCIGARLGVGPRRAALAQRDVGQPLHGEAHGADRGRAVRH